MGSPTGDFCAKLNRDSVEQGRGWWGYVDRRGERSNNGQEAEQGGRAGQLTVRIRGPKGAFR